MTQILERALAQASFLSDTEQDSIGMLILEAIEDERLWDYQFANSQDELAKLADEALAEHKAGKSLPLDIKSF